MQTWPTKVSLVIWIKTLSQADGFASGIGGALSLYLGVAIVMIFELIELLGDLIVEGISGEEEKSERKAEKNNRVA